MMSVGSTEPAAEISDIRSWHSIELRRLPRPRFLAAMSARSSSSMSSSMTVVRSGPFFYWGGDCPMCCVSSLRRVPF